jgi:hypothetical protein
MPPHPDATGQIRRGKGFIPYSGGPKVKMGDVVGPPEDVIRKGNAPANTPAKQSNTKPLSGKKVRGDYSNPMDFVKPSDFLTPIFGQPQKLPGPTEPYGPEDRRYGPYDTRPKPKRKMKRVPDVPPVPVPPKQETDFEPPHTPDDDNSVGVYYFDKGRFLTRGKYNNGKTSRTAQRRG